MKIQKVIITLPVFFLLITSSLYSQDLNAVVKEIKGKVEYKTGDGSWQPLAVGGILNRGDSISTGFDAKAVLELGGTSVLVADALTRLTLSELIEKQGTVVTDLFLDVGNIRTEVHSSDSVSNDFTVRNGISTASVRGTVLDVEVLGDGQGMKVMAWDGMAVVANQKTGRTARVGEAKKKAKKAEAPGDTPEEEAPPEDTPEEGGDMGTPPEPPAEIAAAPLMASGSGGAMVGSLASAIASSSVTMSTKPPSPTSLNTGGGGSVSVASTVSLPPSTLEVIEIPAEIPQYNDVSIDVIWP
ncbi:MAG: FecR domain-containing protein [Spirochaetales bacterium]|nr:FecR domain-containing protein [Spirochaetales bacterium]